MSDVFKLTATLAKSACLLALGSLVPLWHANAGEAQPLPALSAAIGQTSVSGISSGAYMAGQYQFAHASTVVGAAIIAGGPFGCAEARYGIYLPVPSHLLMNETQSVAGCMQNELALYGIPDLSALADQARELADAGKIDPIAELARHKVYLFSGGEDHLVVQATVVAAAELYLRLGVSAANITTGRRAADGQAVPAGHGFVTESAGGDCAVTASPFIVHCGFDQARDLLAHIYGTLAAKSSAPRGQLITFDQDQFTHDKPTAYMAGSGAVYVPDDCRATAGCRIHVAFHGCQQTRSVVGDAFVSGAGFQPWADSNRIIVLFPQVLEQVPILNPLGCWDWWGYTGFDYLTSNAPQITAVHRMVERLSSK